MVVAVTGLVAAVRALVAVVLVLSTHHVNLLLHAVVTKGTHIRAELTEAHGRSSALAARLCLGCEVGAEEALEANDAVVERVAVGRDERALVAVDVPVFVLLHVGRVGVLVADVAGRPFVLLVLIPGCLVVLCGGGHLEWLAEGESL